MLVSTLLAFIAPKGKAAIAFFGYLLAFLGVWHFCSDADMEVSIAAFSANTKRAFETAKSVISNGNRPNESMITVMKTMMAIMAATLLCCCTREQPGKTQQQQLLESAVASYAQHCGGKTTIGGCVELHNSLKESLDSFFADYVQQDPDHHAAEQSWVVEMRRRLEAVR